MGLIRHHHMSLMAFRKNHFLLLGLSFEAMAAKLSCRNRCQHGQSRL
jgi:hypothetical protein